MRLKKYLETDLKNRAGEICREQLHRGSDGEEDQRELRRIHLLLMRQFIRQMVIQYEFQVNVGDMPNQQNKPGRDGQRNQGNNRKGS